MHEQGIIPAAKTESYSARIPNIGVDSAIFDKSVWIEVFWIRVVFRIAQHCPATSIVISVSCSTEREVTITRYSIRKR